MVSNIHVNDKKCDIALTCDFMDFGRWQRHLLLLYTLNECSHCDNMAELKESKSN